MRSIRISRTFHAELATLLAQGVPRFGATIVAQKRARVTNTIRDFLVHYPRRTVDPIHGICAYPVRDTPFVILYDYDDQQLRVHLIIHGSADRTLIDLSTVVW